MDIMFLWYTRVMDFVLYLFMLAVNYLDRFSGGLVLELSATQWFYAFELTEIDTIYMEYNAAKEMPVIGDIDDFYGLKDLLWHILYRKRNIEWIKGFIIKDLRVNLDQIFFVF